jgi:molecular chaperone GrpE
MPEKKTSSKQNIDKNNNNQYNESDIEFEDEGVSSEVVIRKLREKLKQCVKQKQEYLEGWQRTKADFVNARKKDEEARKTFIAFASENIILQLLPILDSFEMAFSHKESWEATPKEWRVGIEHIYSQLLSVLENNHLVQLNPLEEQFDPASQTSVESVSTKDKEKDNMVVEVVQKGYKLHDRIIRPAKVKVAKYFTEKPEQDKKLKVDERMEEENENTDYKQN